MHRFPVVCTDQAINDRVARICSRFRATFQPEFLSSADEAIDFIRYELPEFQLIHLSDEGFDVHALVRAINEDPWLHYGGVIGVYSRKDTAVVEQLPRETNVVTMIRRGEFVETFFRVLFMLASNQQLLFQRDFQIELLGVIHGSVEMDNDPYNARAYASLIANFLYNANYVDLDMRDRVNVALFEMIMNAIEHGNCEISYEEKTQYLTAHGDIIPLIRERCGDPRFASRRVRVTYRISPHESSFRIHDDGAGFDWRRRFSDEAVNFGMHGHGIRMTRHYMANLHYNESGNEVSFEVPHENRANAMPKIFGAEAERVYGDGEVVFREGEESSDLYYIVSGTVDIVSGSQRVASLTQADIFLGEMSFLLGNRRSATVVSRGRSVLRRVTKHDFMANIRRRPHYAIFLARLLAQRLSRLNLQVSAAVGHIAATTKTDS